jgi:plasmid replication initiation protein
MNKGLDVGSMIEFHPYDLFRATNRPMDGKSYQWLKVAMKRLLGTSIETNVRTGKVEEYDEFNLVQRVGYKRDSRDGQRDSAYIQLSEWMYRAVESKEVLTLSRDYFRIKGTLNRRLYEIGRKHCGKQRSWAIGIDKLHNKCGSRSTMKSFRYAVQKSAASDDSMPDYVMDYIKANDQIIYTNKRHGPTMARRALGLNDFGQDMQQHGHKRVDKRKTSKNGINRGSRSVIC